MAAAGGGGAAAGRTYSFKVVLLGEGCVGKTSLVLRYCENKFNDKHITTLQVRAAGGGGAAPRGPCASAPQGTLLPRSLGLGVQIPGLSPPPAHCLCGLALGTHVVGAARRWDRPSGKKWKGPEKSPGSPECLRMWWVPVGGLVFPL